MTNLYFTVCASFVSFLLLLIFIVKKNINNRETSIFRFMLATSFIDCICMIIIIYTAYVSPSSTLLMQIFNKIDFIQYIIWASMFFLYCLYVSRYKNDSYGKVFKFVCILDLIAILIMIISPLNIHIDGSSMYAFGICTNVTYITCALYFAGLIIAILSNVKNIFNKKYIPVVVLILLGLLVFIVNKINPELLIIPAVLTYIDLIMFFTIENPDVKMVEQLNVAKASAEKANRAKTEFLSSMSHEIRTPLNAIVGFSEMIENEVTIEGCKENAKDIVLASQTLLEIVNGILDISKIEANKMEIVNKEYELLPELENLAKLMVPRIGEKPIELKTQFAPDIPAIMYGDIGKIKQVITNILTNAVKYTEKGEINFNVNCVNENDTCSLVISVEDTGRGIKPEKIDSLFTKFNRLDEDKNTTIEGTGLGLAITKSLTEMMGGKIIVQSVYGSGSKFTIYLKQKIVKQEGAIASVEKQEESLNFAGFKILVVDDNKLNLKVADKLLKTYSLSTTLVDSGIECIELIKKGEQYDLILMDDMMPKLRGPEVLEKLKEVEGFKIPVIALTANATTGIREQYLNMGFNDYLAKPINKVELTEILNKYLSFEHSDKTRVLVVDDNRTNIKIAVNLMKNYNFEIDEAISGFECLAKVKIKKYDLIFMDYMMPGMDGIETLKNLKELPNFNTTLIALTADAVDGSREKFINAGFDEYISKPIDKRTLDKVIDKMLNKKVNKNQVLIVDDNKMNIKIAVNLMKNYNFEIEESISGLECIDKVKNKKYDLIFMDYMMPGMNGIETLKHLKELPNFHATAIALTADAVEGSREKFLNAGFDEYVSKPIVKDMLDKVIQRMLNKNDNQKETEEIIEDNSISKVDYLKENGIDVDHGLELLSDIDMYNDTLKEFMSGMNDKFNKIKTYKENNDMENYAIEVHSLKSDSKYLGFTKLAEISYNHEMKSKANDTSYVNDNFNELFNEIKRIFDVVKKYLS